MVRREQAEYPASSARTTVHADEQGVAVVELIGHYHPPVLYSGDRHLCTNLDGNGVI